MSMYYGSHHFFSPTSLGAMPAGQAMTTWYQSRPVLGDRERAVVLQRLQAMEAQSLVFEEKLKESFANIDRIFDKAISDLKPNRELPSQDFKKQKKQELEKVEEGADLDDKEEDQMNNEVQSVQAGISSPERNAKKHVDVGMRESEMVADHVEELFSSAELPVGSWSEKKGACADTVVRDKVGGGFNHQWTPQTYLCGGGQNGPLNSPLGLKVGTGYGSGGGPGNSGRNWRQEARKRGLKGGVADEERCLRVDLGSGSQGDFAGGGSGGGGTFVGREHGGHGETFEQGGGCGSGSGGGPGVTTGWEVTWKMGGVTSGGGCDGLAGSAEFGDGGGSVGEVGDLGGLFDADCDGSRGYCSNPSGLDGGCAMSQVKSGRKKGGESRPSGGLNSLLKLSRRGSKFLKGDDGAPNSVDGSSNGEEGRKILECGGLKDGLTDSWDGLERKAKVDDSSKGHNWKALKK